MRGALFYIALIRRGYTESRQKLNIGAAMTATLLTNALLGIFLFAVVLALLATSIRRGNIDRRATIAMLRRQLHEHRRTEPARTRASWTTSPDAS
jgi:hypothetical protein